MGFNFIQSQAKSHTKAWNDQFTAAASNLFALPTNPVARTFLAKSDKAKFLCEGEKVHVRRNEANLLIYKGFSPIAIADKPSLAIFEMVDSGHGVIEGTVSQVISEANLLVVKVVEGPAK